MRAVLDVNVLVSVLMSPRGTPARIFGAWLDGSFDLIVSPHLLDEYRRVLSYRRIRSRVLPDEVDQLSDWLARDAVLAPDPEGSPGLRSEDPADDYLLALAAAEDAFLVSGDAGLLALRDRAPIMSVTAFWSVLDDERDA